MLELEDPRVWGLQEAKKWRHRSRERSQMPDRPQCHTEYAKTWIQEKTLRSEPETLD